MKALKARRKFDAEQQAKAWEAYQKEREEQLANMTPEEREIEKAKQRHAFELLAFAASLNNTYGR